MDESPIPFRRAHRPTGKPRGARPGNQNALRNGRQSRAYIERRRAFMQLLEMVREAAEMARR
jgi:hypothetical protein